MFNDIHEKEIDHSLDQIQEQLTLEEKIPIHFSLSLQSAKDIQNLLKMTPFFWRSSKENQEKLFQLTELKVTVDVVAWCFSLKTNL